MEPSKEAIAIRITRLNRQILGKVTGGTTKFSKKTIGREALLDALTVLYDECNDDPAKRNDELVKSFVDKYRSTLAELRRTRVCLSDFETLQTIGRGHFGEVHMVREKQTGDVYALKTVRKEQTNKRAAEDERDVLANATNPWVPKLQYAFQDSSNLYLVMELCNGGDLAGLLSRRASPLCERDAAFYIAEVAHALKALHGMGYVHRDVKPHNILLDRCGHVKLADYGSAARLSDGDGGAAPATADYMAPELLAAAACAHTVCQQYCGRLVTNAVSACDYWSLGVIAFELVTMRRPFSKGDEDSIAEILSNIQKYERESNPELPWEETVSAASPSWRALVGGLLRVIPSRRFAYLDTLQHAALAHLPAHNIRDQAPPWVPALRGAEDASCFACVARARPPPSAAPFRSRPPFAGQLPFVGYSYVAPEENEDSTGGFNASHDCTAINLATFKSAEKLAAMRSREIQSLQAKLAEAEALASATVEKTRQDADAEAERQRVRLQAEITALTLQNKRLERQVEVEREERMVLQRSNQELSSAITDRSNAELRNARASAASLREERDALKDDMRRLEERIEQLQAECKRALADADSARNMHQHYKDIIEHVHELRHRKLTELNVRAVDTVAKERAIRRQTLSGGEAESREAAARLAAADASLAREARARQRAEASLAQLRDENKALRDEADDAKRDLASAQMQLGERQRVALASSEQIADLQSQLAQERVRASTLVAQVQELERAVEESVHREASLEEQCARTEARLNERREAAEQRAAAALHDDARHREKVNTLEQLVRQLEREVSALEKRSCMSCAAASSSQPESDQQPRSAPLPTPASPVSASSEARNAHSDTESLADAAHTNAQLSLLKEQLERAEAHLQARAEEIAALKQEARTANLARWRKEREFNELSVETKSTARDLKRAEERLTNAMEARKTAEKKSGELQTELAKFKPLYERAESDVARFKEQLDKLRKEYEITQAEVDRSRNDIRKLKSELQYSEKRRLHAEEQEELSSRERAQLRDELHEVRKHNAELVQNNKALQETCSILEEQLTDLEKLADIHELKNKELENQLESTRDELNACRSRLAEAEKQASERGAAASKASVQHDEAREQARHALSELELLRGRLEARENRVAELENRTAQLESCQCASEAALQAAGRRVRELQEECAALRTRAHQHHAHALQLQASLADVQEELSGAREAAEAAAAWWRTRETKADATLRQQAKLIDFLQAKVEEAGRKKCSLSNKLFGRSGRRQVASPPLRRANRELREEVERLRAKLAATSNSDPYQATPKRDTSRPAHNGYKKSIDCPDGAQDKGLLVVWPDGTRERMRAKCVEETLVLSAGQRELRGRLLSTDATNLPHNEANRAFTIKLEKSDKGTEATVVCASVDERANWVAQVRASAPPHAYAPAPLAERSERANTALYVANNTLAIGTPQGLFSLRGEIQLEWDCSLSPARRADGAGVSLIAQVGSRVLAVYNGLLLHTGILPLTSALKRAASLKPTLTISRVSLPDSTPPHLIQTLTVEGDDGSCAGVACARRVFLLRFDASVAEFKITRSFTVDRPPSAVLITARALYIAGEKPLKVNLPNGALEAFAMDEPTVAAAAKKHSAPKAILLIRENPIEIFLCYSECGIFVDEHGKRTRNEDPKWSSAIKAWEYVKPFLYLVGEDKVTIIYLNDEAYRAPPCTCDSTSLASTVSECFSPEIFTLKIKEPNLIGRAPNGIILSSNYGDGYKISIVEGLSAFKSVGASVESLSTVSDVKGSSSDLAQSMTDLSPQDVSQESIEVTTNFLADIRKRAQQLRTKNRSEQQIQEILTTEVGLKRTMSGKKSPATVSEFDSDSETEDTEESPKTADICAEMFARQVRFQR